jgi:hypothetical protein
VDGIMQKVVRTACPESGYWMQKERINYLQEALAEGYRVVMCNLIQRKDGEQWLEYIVEKED